MRNMIDNSAGRREPFFALIVWSMLCPAIVSLTDWLLTGSPILFELTGTGRYAESIRAFGVFTIAALLCMASLLLFRVARPGKLILIALALCLLCAALRTHSILPKAVLVNKMSWDWFRHVLIMVGVAVVDWTIPIGVYAGWLVSEPLRSEPHAMDETKRRGMALGVLSATTVLLAIQYLPNLLNSISLPGVQSMNFHEFIWQAAEWAQILSPGVFLLFVLAIFFRFVPIRFATLLLSCYGVGLVVLWIVRATLQMLSSAPFISSMSKYQLWATLHAPMIHIGLTFVPAVWLLAWGCRKRRITGHYCPQCEYDLRGNESGRCPECGRQTLTASETSA